MKKLQDQGDGHWYCQACNGSGPPDYRYILSLTLDDFTDQRQVTAFGEAGEQLLGCTAGELKNKADAGGVELDAILQVRKGWGALGPV